MEIKSYAHFRSNVWCLWGSGTVLLALKETLYNQMIIAQFIKLPGLQMKALLQQNPVQARQIMLNSPQLTKALFQVPPPRIGTTGPTTCRHALTLPRQLIVTAIRYECDYGVSFGAARVVRHKSRWAWFHYRRGISCPSSSSSLWSMAAL